MKARKMPEATNPVLNYLNDFSYAYYTDEELAETPAQRKTRLAKSKIAKGVCSKCGKHIGRGLHFHEKACQG